MPIIQPSPWTIGQILDHTNGNQYIASGPNSRKPYIAPDAPEPEDPERQITFCPGDELPAWMTGKIRVCLLDGTFESFCDGESLPTNTDGVVIVDPVSGKPTFNQKAKKVVEATKIYVKQPNEPTKEQVDSGVCLWRNETDSCFYTLCVKPDGTCEWVSSDKGDTDTFADPFIAVTAGVDDYGNTYNVNDNLVLWPDGTIQCLEKKDELGPRVEVDPEDSATWPSDSGPYEMQILVDASGNKVGCVDSAGPHFIVDEDDEVGPSIDVDPDDPGSWPVAPVAPHALQFLCDPATGNACGFVTAQGLKTLPKGDDESITPNGQPVPQEPGTGNDIITQCCTWTMEVDASGNITYPPGHPQEGQTIPAVDANGVPYAPGSTVTSSTDANGVYTFSCAVNPQIISCDTKQPVPKGQSLFYAEPTRCVSGIGPSQTVFLTPTRTSTDTWEFNDPVTGLQACLAVEDPLDIIRFLDIASGGVAVRYIATADSLDGEGITATFSQKANNIKRTCKTCTPKQIDNFTLRTIDIDSGTVVILDTNGVVAQRAGGATTAVESPPGTYTISVADSIAQVGDLSPYLDEGQPFTNPHYYQFEWSRLKSSDRISFAALVIYRESYDVELDCNDQVVSIKDCDNAELPEADWGSVTFSP